MHIEEHRSSHWPVAGLRRRLSVWVGGSAVGAGVLALPDDGPRIFSFSETHGPSALDLVGMVVLIGAWVPTAALIWSERNTIRRSSVPAGGVAVVGLALLVVTIAFDLGPSWVAAVIVLLGAHVLAIRVVVRQAGRDDPSPPGA